jgi:sec-independent protein translocase protein TatB
MFEIGWTEMLVIAVVMIVVVGPKDLPKMLRTFGKTTAKLRTMAGDFQKQFNEALKEAELDEVKQSVDSLRNLNPAAEIKKQLNPFEKAAAEVRSGLDAALKPTPKPAEPANPVTHAAEPLKNGATEMPAAPTLDPPPAAPLFPAMADPTVAAPAEATPPAPSAAPVNGAEPAKPAATPAPETAAPKPRTKAAAKPAAKATPKPAAKPASAATPATAKAAPKAKAASAKTKPAGSAT